METKTAAKMQMEERSRLHAVVHCKREFKGQIKKAPPVSM